MKTINVNEQQANRKIERVIREAFPKMPVNAIYKAFRKKDIKVNGVRVKEDYVVNLGDTLEIYIIDDILNGSPLESGAKAEKHFTVVYEDKNVLIVNKEQGISVHPDKDQESDTLIDLVLEYLKDKGEYSPQRSDFTPSLCHRLDRNTSGLVIIAKNKESLKILLSKIKNKEIKKYYQCLVTGQMEKQEDELRAYLVKQEKMSRVFIDNKKTKDALEIITKYKVLSYSNGISKLEVELVTGRTHQIRAHLAHIGHAIIGDGKYGTNAVNRSLGVKQQELCAYKILFDFKEGNILNYLKGRVFEVQPQFKLLKSKSI